MIDVVPHPRRSKLQALLEAFDFDMDAIPEAARHQLVKPVLVRLIALLDQPPDERGIRHGSEVIDGEDIIAWRQHTIVDVATDLSRGCLWDFVNCPDAPPQDLLRFVERWGVLEDPQTYNGSGSYTVDEFRTEAKRLRSVLVTLVATAAAELVGEETLDHLSALTDFDLWRLEDGPELTRRLGLPMEAIEDVPDGYIYPIALDLRRERWHALRTQGHGLELQAGIIAWLLNTEVGTREGRFIWDREGRRIERIARGVKAIAWSHLAALFTSPSIDVYVCDVCGRPFEFQETVAQRRPRRGKRRFCSDSCRLEAKRAANRESWRKNSTRWRPNTKQRNEDGSQS
jgi:hypothetical protein